MKYSEHHLRCDNCGHEEAISSLSTDMPPSWYHIDIKGRELVKNKLVSLPNTGKGIVYITEEIDVCSIKCFAEKIRKFCDTTNKLERVEDKTK